MHDLSAYYHELGLIYRGTWLHCDAVVWLGQLHWPARSPTERLSDTSFTRRQTTRCSESCLGWITVAQCYQFFPRISKIIKDIQYFQNFKLFESLVFSLNHFIAPSLEFLQFIYLRSIFVFEIFHGFKFFKDFISLSSY